MIENSLAWQTFFKMFKNIFKIDPKISKCQAMSLRTLENIKILKKTDIGI